MPRSTACSGIILLSSLVIFSCNNGQNQQLIKDQIKANQAALAKKQSELSDLNYRVTNNSLHVGTKDYDSTIDKDFTSRSAAIQASIDSLKAEISSLEGPDK